MTITLIEKELKQIINTLQIRRMQLIEEIQEIFKNKELQTVEQIIMVTDELAVTLSLLERLNSY